MLATLSSWEAGLLLWVQTYLRNPVTDPILSAFTHLGDAGALFIALTLALLLWPKTRKVGLACAFGLLFSLLFTNVILKHLVGRVRPWVDFPAILPLVVEGDPLSFPSGHTSAAFAFALAFVRTWPRDWAHSKAVKVGVVVLATLMALSRLYVGVHYPTDVLGGFIAGDLAGLAGWGLSVWLPRRLRPSEKIG